MVVGFMDYEAGQKLLAEGYMGPSATRVVRCLKERNTPTDRDWYERLEAFMDERGKLMHSSPSKVRMDGEWVDHLLQMRDGRYVKLDVDKLHALARTGAALYREAIESIGAEVFGAIRGELPPVEGGFSGWSG